MTNLFIIPVVRLCERLINGDNGQEGHNFINASRLIGLKKDQNDCRPIAIGEALRRIISRFAIGCVGGENEKLFRNMQY